MNIINSEICFDKKFHLAEGPFYDHRYDRLSWVDIPEGTINTLQNGEYSVIKLQSMVGAAIPLKESDGFIAACTDGLYIVRDGQVTRVLDMSSQYKNYQRSNDAKCDSMGRIWFGSSSLDEELGVGGDLYMFDKNQLTKVIPDTKIANGMSWSADGTKFYWADSLDNAVYVFDYDMESGSISNRRVLCEITDGVPDGLCIDNNDNLWIAIWGGRRVENRDGKTGELLGKVIVDAEHVTCCCFGGTNMDILYITTSGDGLSGEGDGRIFKCSPGVTGPYINCY